jgi:hypothetical protein
MMSLPDPVTMVSFPVPLKTLTPDTPVVPPEGMMIWLSPSMLAIPWATLK